MIFCGFGGTRFFGSTLKNIQDFVNVAHGFHKLLVKRGKSLDGSNDVYVECCKLAYLLNSNQRSEAEKNLARALVKMSGSDQ